MKLRKLLAILMVLVMMLAMAMFAVGCGEDNNTNDDDDEDERTSDTVDDDEDEDKDEGKQKEKDKTTSSTTDAAGDDKRVETHETTAPAQNGDGDRAPVVRPGTPTASDAALLIGEWEGEMDFGGMLEMVMVLMNMGGYFDFDGLEVGMSFVFREDGTMTAELLVDDSFTDDVADCILDGMDDLLAGLAEQNGYESLDEFCEAEGTSLEELKEQMAAQLTESLSGMTEEELLDGGCYEIRDGKLYFGDEENGIDYEMGMTFTVSDEELVLDYEAQDEDEAALIADWFPMELDRVA